MTNLIQICVHEKVKFHGTIQDNSLFPFHIVDLQEGDDRINKNRPIIQAYGTRANYVAQSSDIRASILRHGGGKVRAARIATTLVECNSDTWVYETRGRLRRTPHAATPANLPDGASPSTEMTHKWKEWLLRIHAMSSGQRTPCWMISRLFCFSSTSLHDAVNVKSSVYLNTVLLRQLHANCLSILRLNPRKLVTIDNAAEMEAAKFICSDQRQ